MDTFPLTSSTQPKVTAVCEKSLKQFFYPFSMLPTALCFKNVITAPLRIFALSWLYVHPFYALSSCKEC